MRQLRALKAGDTIRESWLYDLTTAVNRNTRMLATLEDQFLTGNANGFQRPWTPQAGGGGEGMPTSITFAESSRQYATVTITDSNSDTHSVQIATSIVMTASQGGTSYSWTFTYASG